MFGVLDAGKNWEGETCEATITISLIDERGDNDGTLYIGKDEPSGSGHNDGGGC